MFTRDKKWQCWVLFYKYYLFLINPEKLKHSRVTMEIRIYFRWNKVKNSVQIYASSSNVSEGGKNCYAAKAFNKVDIDLSCKIFFAISKH